MVIIALVFQNLEMFKSIPCEIKTLTINYPAIPINNFYIEKNANYERRISPYNEEMIYGYSTY